MTQPQGQRSSKLLDPEELHHPGRGSSSNIRARRRRVKKLSHPIDALENQYSIRVPRTFLLPIIPYGRDGANIACETAAHTQTAYILLTGPMGLSAGSPSHLARRRAGEGRMRNGRNFVVEVETRLDCIKRGDRSI